MNNFILLCILLTSILGTLYAADLAKENEVNISIPNLSIYEHEQTKEIIQLVYKAVNLIESQGEKAFPEFRVEDSKWFFNDTYVFIWGMDGMRYVYPRDVSGEGLNMLELKDINRRPIGKMFVETAEKGEGWVFYEWTLPGGDEPEWKSTFIKKAVTPDGIEYLVGTGKYNIPMEKVFIETIVNDAVDILQYEGEVKAFARFNSSADKFIFLQSYIFVKTFEGVELVNPFSPQMVGENLINKQDANGKYFVKEELKILQNQDSCWMDYMWPKPGAEEPSLKISYIKKTEVKGEIFVIGAGYYLD